MRQVAFQRPKLFNTQARFWSAHRRFISEFQCLSQSFSVRCRAQNSDETPVHRRATDQANFSGPRFPRRSDDTRKPPRSKGRFPETDRFRPGRSNGRDDRPDFSSRPYRERADGSRQSFRKDRAFQGPGSVRTERPDSYTQSAQEEVLDEQAPRQPTNSSASSRREGGFGYEERTQQDDSGYAERFRQDRQPSRFPREPSRFPREPSRYPREPSRSGSGRFEPEGRPQSQREWGERPGRQTEAGGRPPRGQAPERGWGLVSENRPATEYGAPRSNYQDPQTRRPKFYEAQQDDSPLKKIKDEWIGEGLFGVNPVLLALQTGKRKCYKLYIQREGSGGKMKKNTTGLGLVKEVAEALGVPVVIASKHDLNVLTDDAAHQGVLLQCSRLKFSEKDAFEPASAVPADEPAPLWVALDEVTDTHNMGAILRSAHFLGAAGVITCDRNSAPLNAVVSKSSAGALEVMKIHSADKLQKTLAEAKENGWRIIGATSDLTGTFKGKRCTDFSLQRPTILVIGSEGKGLRTNVKKACTDFVIIGAGEHAINSPAKRGLDSLNVSVAAGIIMHQLLASRLNQIPGAVAPEMVSAEAAGLLTKEEGVEESAVDLNDADRVQEVLGSALDEAGAEAAAQSGLSPDADTSVLLNDVVEPESAHNASTADPLDGVVGAEAGAASSSDAEGDVLGDADAETVILDDVADGDPEAAEPVDDDAEGVVLDDSDVEDAEASAAKS